MRSLLSHGQVTVNIAVGHGLKQQAAVLKAGRDTVVFILMLTSMLLNRWKAFRAGDQATIASCRKYSDVPANGKQTACFENVCFLAEA